jgi:hypothetical protein
MSKALHMRSVLIIKGFDFSPSERHPHSFPSWEYVFSPDKFPADVQPEILYRELLKLSLSMWFGPKLNNEDHMPSPGV